MPNDPRGCSWTGQLMSLEDTLDPSLHVDPISWNFYSKQNVVR